MPRELVCTYSNKNIHGGEFLIVHAIQSATQALVSGVALIGIYPLMTSASSGFETHPFPILVWRNRSRLQRYSRLRSQGHHKTCAKCGTWCNSIPCFIKGCAACGAVNSFAHNIVRFIHTAHLAMLIFDLVKSLGSPELGLHVL